MIEEKKYELDWGGRQLVIETGKYALQANGSCLVRYGDTMVMATATMSKNAQPLDYFPLSVVYEEKLYAAGKIKGSRFIKREGRPTDEAVLTGRLIDRAIRPLFDDRIRNEVQVIITVLSIDSENDPDIVGLIAASVALSISDIPWSGPIAGATVGRLRNQFILNPTYQQREEGGVYFTVAGIAEKVIMLEAEATEIDVTAAGEAIFFGQDALPRIIQLLSQIKKEVGRPKLNVEDLQAEQIEGNIDDLNKYFLEARKFLDERIEQYMFGKLKETKRSRKDSLAELKELLKKYLEEDLQVPADMLAIIMNKADKLVELRISEAIVKKAQRVDGRQLTEIRPLEAQVGLLPRTHGSALFKRGETHILSVVTLGGPGMEQILDGMEIDGKKHYMHHYNFPPFSVGETGRMFGPSRRDIGHGALAEKALAPVLPDKKDFPYTIRVVSEVMSSNGSSSMASVCGSTLSLMDAGVPLKAPVAGIAMGLAQDGQGGWKVITDLQDLEDGYGGMDFKVTATNKGITAIQMDTKSEGLVPEMIKEALEQARAAIARILRIMEKTIKEPRVELSPYAPRIVTLQINPERIRDLIGPGGKVINQIIDETGATIDIEQDGQVHICSVDKKSLEAAVEQVKHITKEIEVGEIIEGPVTRIMDFGALVELAPGRDGMVHISEIAPQRINKVSDVLKVGQMVKVKVLRVEPDGKVALSVKKAEKNNHQDSKKQSYSK